MLATLEAGTRYTNPMVTWVVARGAVLAVLASSDVVAFENELRKVAGMDVRVTRDQSSIQLDIEAKVLVPSAESHQTEMRSFRTTVTLAPYIDEAALRARRAAAEKAERAAWQKVASLQCDGKEFTDHYIDGLCFRTKNTTQERQVVAYRRAREVLMNVPRHHWNRLFAVTVRLDDGEPTDCSCGMPCKELRQRIISLMTEYP